MSEAPVSVSRAFKVSLAAGAAMLVVAWLWAQLRQYLASALWIVAGRLLRDIK